MRIYLVRHSEAVDRVPSMPDAARYLSARGRVSFREMARRFRDAGGLPTRILTGPFVRAVQTAEILSETLRYDGEVVVDQRLSPGFDVATLNAMLDGCFRESEIAFVGHEPDLGGILTRLLSLPEGYAMRKGAIAALDLPIAGVPLRAGLAWLLTGDRRIEDPALLVR
ncbi:histidine phosphatase family protein [Candidatus Deferrimicrobium sp.]|uniref:SixA phosphatase family protein n=1 Tax=Candidatus Deferrimicrobium sp. TaxID=3060586 RepID=UPI00272201A6|nr:histidine phosphatase family protein [Candidatus Deferrimicrobium sp.]MDO8737404.1 histidine phosphatase family protein [Candidatus Deferrimicrobium sp.]